MFISRIFYGGKCVSCWVMSFQFLCLNFAVAVYHATITTFRLACSFKCTSYSILFERYVIDISHACQLMALMFLNRYIKASMKAFTHEKTASQNFSYPTHHINLPNWYCKTPFTLISSHSWPKQTIFFYFIQIYFIWYFSWQNRFSSGVFSIRHHKGSMGWLTLITLLGSISSNRNKTY